MKGITGRPPGGGGRRGLAGCCAAAVARITIFANNARAILAAIVLARLVKIILQSYFLFSTGVVLRNSLIP